MKIEVGLINIHFIPETEYDYFCMGVITSKNKSHVQWLDGKPIEFRMQKEDVIIGLYCNRD